MSGDVPAVAYPPTAVHALAALHETPWSVATVVPEGLGVVLTVQLVPFHRSASVLFGSTPEGFVV